MYEGKHIHYSEVDHKPLCSYSPKLCKQRRLSGYAFCIRHVLEDRTAPFRQCEYVAKYNSQRCTTPIPKTQDRKYCSSHLQVMGVLPKKERKKKHDTLDSLAINITVPSLALKVPNGLAHLTQSSPSSLACLLPLDPYVYCKGEKVRKEGSNQGAKPSGRPTPNHKQKHKDCNVAPPVSLPTLPSRGPTLSTQQAEAPTQKSTAPTCPTTPTSPLPRTLTLPRTSSGTSCTSLPIQNGDHTLRRITNSMPEICRDPALGKRRLTTAPGQQPSRSDLHSTPAKPSNCGAHQVPCLVQLKRLMALQRSKQQEELNLHVGSDWSQDSGEEDDSQVERVLSYQIQILQDKRSTESSCGGSRRERLVGLCSYLRQKHRLLRQEERSLRIEKGSRHTFREVLLQAASQDSNQAAQLLQEHQHSTTSNTRTAGWCERRSDSGLCAAQMNGEACTNRSLPFTRHCFQHVLQNRCQQLFSSCTARFADGAQCSVPVFDITHQTPLCEEHAQKMDNFLRGDVSRRTYHHQQQLQQRRRLKKAKLPVLGKKQKKKSRRAAVHRPQKPIPPAMPQGNLGLPSILCLPSQPGGIRSPLTPDLSADELPDDLTSDISDIPHDLELNQEDFSDVLPRFPDDLQDFLFEGKTSELLPTTEEAEELVRVLQAMGSYPESLACLSSMAELGPLEGSDCQGMEGGVVDLLSARLSAETLSTLELDTSLLPTSEDAFSSSPPSPHPPLTPPSSVGHLTEATNMQQRQPPALLAKTDDPKLDLGNLALTRDISHGSWGVLALPLGDSAQFHNLAASDGLLVSTALSTPPTPMLSAPCQPTTLSALPESSLTIPVTSTSSSSSSSSLCTGQLKHPCPPLFNHCGIPADLQPHHSAPAPTMDQT